MPVLKYYDNLYIEALQNAEFDVQQNLKNSKKLTPIIFSHGVCSNNHCFVGLHKEFASHGYIVFALDHLDGTANYTELSDGTPKPFNSLGRPDDLKERRK